MKEAKESEMPYHPVRYEIAVTLRAYSVQALLGPTFNKLIILLCDFHIEFAFYGAKGTYISDSGLKYLLCEVGILDDCSVAGFVIGKFYNRCTVQGYISLQQQY